MREFLSSKLLTGLMRATPEQLAAIELILQIPVVAAPVTSSSEIITQGRLQYRPGFSEVWFGGELYDLHKRAKARFCIQYLVESRAFDAVSARHLEKEIDPYVIQKSKLPPSAEIKIQHYFKDANGKLTGLRTGLIKSAGRNGRFYLNVK